MRTTERILFLALAFAGLASAALVYGLVVPTDVHICDPIVGDPSARRCDFIEADCTVRGDQMTCTQKESAR